jgi:nicotinic acid mononucleotide adenylyltransferase
MTTRNPEKSPQVQQSICLFGLSADPPTGMGGHVGMVEALLSYFAKETHSDNDTNESPLLDNSSKPNNKIYILPVYRHTFASKQSRLLRFEHRLAMCRLAFADYTSVDPSSSIAVEISEAERQAFDWAMQNK